MDASNGLKKKPHIKKPLNAYFVWSRMFRPKMMEQNPDITVCQANVLLGKIWKEMSVEQKKPYFKESERMKKQHEADFPETQSHSKPQDKQPKSTNYETLLKNPEMGDRHFRVNRFYQIPHVLAIPSGQVFLPLAHNYIPETRIAFYTPYSLSNRMPSCPQQLYVSASPYTRNFIG